MPTGYTADVVDGKITELEPFVLQLARGMGALITMRDEPWDAAIPERFEPSDYHAKRLEESKAARDEIRAMSEADCVASALAEAEKYDADVAKWRADRELQRERYDAMIAKVEVWQGAPEGLKEFGLQQLHQGRDFDCPALDEYYRPRPSTDGSEWRSAKLEKLERDILYHAAEHAKEVERAEARTAWVAQLRKSLAGERAEYQHEQELRK